MAKGDTLRTQWLQLYFIGTGMPSVADNAGLSPFVEHVVALHVADPGSGGSQLTHETAYVGYSRVLVPRNSAGWTVVGNTVRPTAAIGFGVCTASPGATITHWSLSRGGGQIDYTGPVSPPIVMATLVQPVLTTDSLITET